MPRNTPILSCVYSVPGSKFRGYASFWLPFVVSANHFPIAAQFARRRRIVGRFRQFVTDDGFETLAQPFKVVVVHIALSA